MKMKDYLLSAAADFNVKLTEEQVNMFEVYFDLLVEWNKKLNLTAITDEMGVAVKHFTDSLSILNYIDIPEKAKVIDVGTGAGFPGIVLKIVRPDIELSLLDSLKKRFLFLEEVIDKLNFEADFLQGRAEEYGNDLDCREAYDLVVSRAVANLNTLSEYCLPLTRISGTFAAFKGSGADEEIASARRAISILGGKVKSTNSFELPYDCGQRTIVCIEKIKPTPEKYPRNNGKIKSKPL